MEWQISDELRERLQKAPSDMEACRILAEGGIDLEEMERALSDDELEGVSGGWMDGGNDLCCYHCGNRDRNMVSRQFWASLFASSTKYRCKVCNGYFTVDSIGTVHPA